MDCPPEGDLPWEESPNLLFVCDCGVGEDELATFSTFIINRGETYSVSFCTLAHLLSNDGNLTVSLNAD